MQTDVAQLVDVAPLSRIIHDFVRRDSDPVEVPRRDSDPVKLQRRDRSPVVPCAFSPLDVNLSLTRVVSQHASRVNDPGYRTRAEKTIVPEA